jgi:hypothetical protein
MAPHPVAATSLAGWTMPVTGRHLERLNTSERALMLGMWHATNELNALQKMILLANNLDVSGPIEEAGRSLNSWMLIKIFATKAFEAWEFFKSAQSFTDFRQTYLADSDAGKLVEAKDWLGKYFGRKNLLETVRNKAGAHYDYDFVLAASDQIADLDSFVLLTEHQGNSLYWAAEEVMAQGFKRAAKADGDLRSVVDQIVGEVIEVATRLDDLAQCIGIIAVKKAYASEGETFPRTQVAARRGASSDIPYFVDFSQPLSEDSTSASSGNSRSSARPG